MGNQFILFSECFLILPVFFDDRAIVMYVFYGFILFIVVLFLFGLILGVCGYSSSKEPSDRSSIGNCGGIFLMA